jgi:methyl-accepting chemotaxis protein
MTLHASARRKEEGSAAPAIEAGFQLRLAGKVALVLALGAAAPVVVLWVVSGRGATGDYPDLIQRMGALRIELVRVSVLSGAGQLLLMAALVGVVGLFASHKIAGPLIRFERAVRGLARGDLSQDVRFRRGDQDASLAEAFAAVRDRLRNRAALAQRARSDLRALLEEVRRLEREGGADKDKGLQPLVPRIRAAAGLLREAGTPGGGSHDA